MDILEFLELCVGNWFSQRSSFHLEEQQGTSDKSELSITWLSADEPDVIKLCETHKIDAKSSLGGHQLQWDTACDWGKPKKIGSGLMIFVPNEEKSTTGSLLSRGYDKTGHYELQTDESLYLSLNSPEISIEERIWFVSPNLRFRTSIVKNTQSLSRTAFYSEIRKLS